MKKIVKNPPFSAFLDFASYHPKNKQPRRSRRIFLLIFVMTVLGIVYLTHLSNAQSSNTTKQPNPHNVIRKTLTIPERNQHTDKAPIVKTSVQQQATRTPMLRSERIRIHDGNNLSQLFGQVGLSPAILRDIININNDTKRLNKIHPGQTLDFYFDKDDEFQSLVYAMNTRNNLIIHRKADGYTATLDTRPVQIYQQFANATIQSSLFEAGQKAGLNDQLMLQLAVIFGWDIDFSLDIRPGDQFSIIYEQQYLDGDFVGTGSILAAEFINQGSVYRAVRYTDTQGQTAYYTPNGDSLHKTFLRNPVTFHRISGYFSLNRKHPILHRIRAHRGVDYAAPRGTPIKASGDGTIVRIGRNGGYGKMIKIQHGQKYRFGKRYATIYAHMNRFAKHLREGSRVSQGQVIGYVGSTGLATGPHLHYEFLVNGIHQDPLKVKLPKALPIKASTKSAFLTYANNMVDQLRTYKKHIIVADNNPVLSSQDVQLD